MEQPKAVSQRYFVSHIKELPGPVEVTIQRKDGSGTIETLGFFFPFNTLNDVTAFLSGNQTKKTSK